MDLFKTIKELKSYSKELSSLFESIEITGTKIKIGKYRILNTFSEDAAKQLHTKLRAAVESELIEVSNVYERIESTLESIQCDLFKEPETTGKKT